jgi:hypothetical protein
MLKKSLVLVSMAAVVAVLVAGVFGGFGSGQTPALYASSLAGISAAGETGIQIQNLDQSQPASITADFYRSDGPFEQQISLPTTAPGAAANIWLPGTSLPTGAYAAIINADRQIAAIARTDWPQSDGAAIYSNVIPGKNVALPLAVRRYFGQSSLVSIQNTDTGADASVTVKVFESGAANPTVEESYTVKPGTSITLDLDQDLEFEALGEGFLGSIFVESATDVGVQSFVDIATSAMAVYAFEGVPAEMASDTLYAALFRAKQYPNPNNPNSGRLDTGISVVNPGTTQVSVSLTYYGAGGACAGQQTTTTPVNIAPNSSHVFYQGAPASQGLPENCYGAALIEATGGGVLAIVNDSQNEGMTAAAFNAVSAEQGAQTVALPLWRRNHANGLSTGISAMNIGTSDAQITVAFTRVNNDGSTTPVSCGAECTQTVGPNEAAVWWPPMISALSDGTFGSATVTSNQPVTVIVNDVNVAGGIDAATYNGIKADVQ